MKLILDEHNVEDEERLNEEYLCEMARIEQVGSIFYSVMSRNEHNPPHFHFEKKQGKGKYVFGRILFTEPKYLISNRYCATLENNEAERLYDLLKRKVPEDRFNRTYWERAIDDWNAIPGVTKLNLQDYPNPPDYTKL